MKLLFIGTTVYAIPTVGYGGIERMMMDFVETASQRHEVAMAAPLGSVPPAGVKLVSTIELPVGQEDELKAMEYYETLANTYDAIHDFSHRQFLGTKRAELPIVHMMWDPIQRVYPKAKYNQICSSEWQARRFRNAYGLDCKVKDVCVDTDYFVPSKNHGERWLFIGKMTPEKGALPAISVAKLAKIPLDLIGGRLRTDPDDYEKMVKASCDGETVSFLGEVPQKEKLEYLQNAKGLLYTPQQEEAHSLVMCEALACGVPVLSFSAGGFPEVIEQGITGFLAENESDMLRYIPRIGEINRAYCRSIAEERFSRKKAVEWYEREIYKPVSEGMRW